MVRMRGIFLVGFMGAGKSSVGAAVADRLGIRFIDLDDEISRRLGSTIPEIFARRGEAVFRAAEHDELARFADIDDVVVATGGGAFCSESNRDMIHRSGGVSVFLDVPWEELQARLVSDHRGRPMYDDTGQAQRLYEERLQHYRCAMVKVSLDGIEAPVEVAGRVIESLREIPCAT
jgi:shikimate kinase